MTVGDRWFFGIMVPVVIVCLVTMAWKIEHHPPQKPFVYMQDANGIGPTPY